MYSKRFFLAIILFLFLIVSCSSEKSTFKKAVEANTIDEFENFISKFPESPLADSALVQVYALTRLADSLDIYKQFVTRHPETVFTDSVMNRIWTITQHDSSIESYKQFIADYPEHSLKDSAFAEMFSLIVSKNKMPLYEQFLADFPEHNLKDSVVTLIYKLTDKQCTVEGYKLFVKKYPESEHTKSAKFMLEKFELDEILTIYLKNDFSTVKKKYPNSKHTEADLKKYTYNPNYTLGKILHDQADNMGIQLPHDLFQRVTSSYGYGYNTNASEGQAATELFRSVQMITSILDVNDFTFEWVNFIGHALKHCTYNYRGNSFVSKINYTIFGPLYAGKALELCNIHAGKPLSFALTNAALDMLADHKNMITDIVTGQLEDLKSKISDPFLLKKLNKLNLINQQ